MSRKQVSVRLVAEGGERVRAEFAGVGEAGARAFGRIERQADAAGAVMRRVLGALATAVSVRELARYADTWTELRARVDLATGSQEAGAAVMDRLAGMARRTYSSLEQTAESWLANATALRELGLTTRESLDFTEALNNAMVVSGARAERAEQIQRALAQAMALGQLRGAQLNTVIQNGGRLAELLAAEMGVTVNRLRVLGAEGAITGDVIRRALVGNLELLRAEADAMPATIGDAFTLLRNAALALVGALDSAAGVSAVVAGAIILVADNLDLAASGAAALGAAFLATRAASLGLTAALVALKGALIATGIGALVVGAGLLVGLFLRLVTAAGSFGGAMRLLGDVGTAVWRDLGTAGGALQKTMAGVAWSIAQSFVDGFRWITDQWDSLVNHLVAPFNALMAGLGREFRLVSANPISQALGRASTALGARADQAFREAGAAAGETGLAEAWAALAAAITRAEAEGGDALDGMAAMADRVTEALGRAGSAGRQAGRAVRAGAEDAATGWAATLAAVEDYALRGRDIGKDLGDALVRAFRGAEDAMARFVTEGRLGVSELVRAIMADLARLATRRFITAPLAGMLGSALSGLGGSWFASVLHAGGIAGAPGPARAVPATVFAGAGRFHGGGWPGLRPGEVPAILERGERVLSRREARDYGAAPVTVHIHARDAESFRAGRTQIAADIARAVQRGRRGL